MYQQDAPQNLTELSVSEAVALGAEALPLFGKLFFPRTFRQPSPAFHWELGDHLYSPARRNAFEVFRDGAKTTLLRAFTAQRISYGISRLVMYISATQTHSMLSLRWIKRQVEHNKRWTAAFGLSPGDKWSDEYLEIKHGPMGHLVTVLALGVTGQVRGFNPDDFRPDLIILDDVLTDENAATKDQRDKIEALVMGAILDSLAPESDAPLAKICFLNTPMASGDAIERCMGDASWNGVRYGVFDEEGRSRWEERYPTRLLLEDKAARTARGLHHIWMKEKECKIVPGLANAFNVKNLQYWDTLPPLAVRVIGIDPASADSKKSDYNVVLTVGCFGDAVYVVAYSRRQNTMPDQAANDFFEQCINCGPIMRAGVESIGYQRTLKWYIDKEMPKRRVWVPLEMVQDMRRKSDRIMQNLPGLVAYRKLYIHPTMLELVEEMEQYNPTKDAEHDDILDALSIGVQMLMPYLGLTLEGDYMVVDDESQYRQLAVGGCP